MKKALLASLMFSLLMAVSVSYADVPPPPVNQYLGIPDGTFGNLKEAQCRGCHEERAFSMFSSFDQTDVPSRHHITVMRDNNECKDCHDIMYDPITQKTELGVFRDCQYCHLNGRVGKGNPDDVTTWMLPPGTPHHRTPFAKKKQCYRCHGSVVNNAETITHTIPTYNKTMVTPNTCRDTYGYEGDMQCTPEEIAASAYNSCPVKDPVTGQCIGGCQSCHKAGTVDGYTIGENKSNHHNTTLGATDGNECKFCHGNTLLGEDILDIRKCEECHGISTLHNIMVNYTAHQTTHGYGHVGVSQDCFGCHGWYVKYNDFAPEQGPYVPQINGITKTEFAVNETAEVTIEGLNFVNTIDVYGYITTYTSKVVIDDLNGNVITIEPTSITETTITFTFPGNLALGRYYLYLSKADKVSGMYAVSVNSPVVLTTATQNGSDIIIQGNNFGPAPAREYTSDIGVYVTKDGATEKADIILWTDSEIIVRSTAGCGDVLARTVMGNVAGTAVCSSGGSDPAQPAGPTQGAGGSADNSSPTKKGKGKAKGLLKTKRNQTSSDPML